MKYTKTILVAQLFVSVGTLQAALSIKTSNILNLIPLQVLWLIMLEML